MTAAFTVKATVIDIRADSPRVEDTFWVDTQIWKAMTYSRVPCPPHLREYPKYIKAVRLAGANLTAGTVHLAELGRCVEHAEKELYEDANNLREMNIKSFRAIATARADVTAHMQAAWNMLMQLATLAPNAVTSNDVVAAAAGLCSGDLLDAGDSIQLAEARRSGIKNVLSDDRDFATVEGLTLFTANENVLRAAASSKKTLRRR